MTSIRQQLQKSLFLTIAVIVLLMTIAFFLVEVLSFRQLVIESVVPRAEMVAIHVRRPLAQRDNWGAQEILATLATDPTIEGAYLFNLQNEPFAYYQQNRIGHKKILNPDVQSIHSKEEILSILSTKTQQTLFSWKHFSIFVPVIHNNETIGTVYLINSLAPFYTRMYWWLLAAAAATLIAIGTGLALAHRLQQRITDPVIRLAAMMQLVTEDGDLTPRAEIQGAGEIATLSHGFNQMLEAINERDNELLTINFGLEERIAERTEELNCSLQVKDILLREIHHRVKNNLQIISSLLNMQMKTIQDPLAIEALRSSMSRIRSMAFIHEKLYRTDKQSAQNDLGNYLHHLSQEILRLHSISGERITLHLDLAVVEIDFDRLIPLALIFNELITNTFKHAFSLVGRGEVTVLLRQIENKVTLTVRDNGRGLPENFQIETTTSVGLRLVKRLVTQAQGEIHLLRIKTGTEAIVSFPLTIVIGGVGYDHTDTYFNR